MDSADWRLERRSSWSLSPRAVRYLVAISLVVVGFQSTRWVLLSPWQLGGDMEAYWQAALRLREGLPLYPALSDLDAHSVFRYSAWFAAAWVPITYLPKEPVTAVWVALQLVASAVVLRPLVIRGAPGWVLLLLLAPLMTQSAWYGQIQPLVVFMILWGLPRTSGPIWIGVAASLKAFPALFALVYVARRQWGRAALTLAVALVLSAPTLLFDISHYPFDAGLTVSFWSLSPHLWLLTAVVSLAVCMVAALRRSRWIVLVAGAATILASPRVYLDMISYLLPAIHEPPEEDRAR
jgi:hypothetical protein